ncbi:MAG: hypothetical protein DWH91_03505 [Planctomycetota bacterium]|nr:MAG: hypothetical protein DWH91_03505 [Planctomycetota bacterium]
MPPRGLDVECSPTSIVKLGGSLLELPDLPLRLSHHLPLWGERPLIVVGGGPAANVVRDWDRIHRLGEFASHDLAVTSLRLTAHLIEQIWPAARRVSWPALASAWHANQVPVADVSTAFQWGHQHFVPLPPEDWTTTTDTIAAWIAWQCGTEALHLLKSIPAPKSLELAAQGGAVDLELPSRCRDWNLSIRWSNLRAGAPDDPPIAESISLTDTN